MKQIRNFLALFTMVSLASVGIASPLFAADVQVRFDKPLQEWDGFGVNYVETSQTRDYGEWPQDYGGFDTLPEEEKQEIIKLFFGEDGLKAGLVKMFIDPFHEGKTAEDNDNADPLDINLDGYTHKRTTKSMRYFVREGLKLTRENGRDLTIINTLYGPPPWTTEQKMIRGRDMDKQYVDEIAEYIAAFAKFMRDREGFPVKYVSIHNEGTHPIRYTESGRDAEGLSGHDYNLLWTGEDIADMLVRLRKVLDANGMQDVGPTPGECTYWSFFRPVAKAIAANPEAMKSIGLITSHGFDGGNDPTSNWYSPLQDSVGIGLLRSKRPELHAWTTSASWGKMDILMASLIERSIYRLGLNGFIPWAAVQRHSQWTKGDPNPGTAIYVDDSGNYEVRRGYYIYKQFSRAGQPGMRIASVSSTDPYLNAVGFASDDTNNPDSFILYNQSWHHIDCKIEISGTMASRYEVHRTIVDTFPDWFWISKKPDIEHYKKHRDAKGNNEGEIEYTAPPLSITTFTAK